MSKSDQTTVWESVVSGVVDDYKRLDGAVSDAVKAGAMDINGPLYGAIWATFDAMLGRIDVDGWVSWFIFENACGRKSQAAKGCGKRGMRPIGTPRQLAVLIVESLPEKSRSGN